METIKYYFKKVKNHSKCNVLNWELIRFSLVLIILSYNTSIFVYSQNVGINAIGSAPNSKALLDVDATGMSPKAGVLFPRLTTTERNAITGTIPEGLMIYNTTTQCFEAWNQSTLSWVSYGCIGCQLPVGFAASAATSVASTSFVANWGASANATGYYLDVSTNSSFSSFVTGYNNLSVSNVTTYTVNTNLSASTTYYYRVRAINACGTTPNSNVISLTTTAPSWSCGSALSISHVSGTVAPENKSINYGTVQSSISGASKCWITQNLGSTNQATSATDNTDAAAGWYWQFNRKQGYKPGPTPSWTITAINESSNWTSANDPCTIELGTGWRIPTSSEWTTADTWNTSTDAYNSVLKLHAGGWLLTTNGSVGVRGNYGYFWSTAQATNTTATNLNFNGGYCGVFPDDKAAGLNIRCIKD